MIGPSYDIRQAGKNGDAIIPLVRNGRRRFQNNRRASHMRIEPRNGIGIPWIPRSRKGKTIQRWRISSIPGWSLKVNPGLMIVDTRWNTSYQKYRAD